MVILTSLLAFLRLTMLGFWTMLIGIMALLCNGGGWKGIIRVAALTRIWCIGLKIITNVKVRCHGADCSRVKGGLIISNHHGYLDIMVAGSLFKLRFAAKKEVASWPLLGWALNSSRPVLVDRTKRTSSREVLKEFRATMNHDLTLLVFPEGTSSAGEGDLLPFKSTAFEAAEPVDGMTEGYTVYPMLLSYEPSPDGQPLAWYGDMELLPHAWRILKYWRMAVDVYLLDEMRSQPGEGRKEFAARVYKVMNDRYQEILATQKR